MMFAESEFDDDGFAEGLIKMSGDKGTDLEKPKIVDNPGTGGGGTAAIPTVYVVLIGIAIALSAIGVILSSLALAGAVKLKHENEQTIEPGLMTIVEGIEMLEAITAPLAASETFCTNSTFAGVVGTAPNAYIVARGVIPTADEYTLLPENGGVFSIHRISNSVQINVQINSLPSPAYGSPVWISPTWYIERVYAWIDYACIPPIAGLQQCIPGATNVSKCEDITSSAVVNENSSIPVSNDDAPRYPLIGEITNIGGNDEQHIMPDYFIITHGLRGASLTDDYYIGLCTGVQVSFAHDSVLIKNVIVRSISLHMSYETDALGNWTAPSHCHAECRPSGLL